MCKTRGYRNCHLLIRPVLGFLGWATPRPAADSIFRDQAPDNQNLFIGNQRSEAYKHHASQISSNFKLALLYPISILLPLWMNRSERSETEEFRVCLNRHQVLHGESTDYATEQSSLQAISLLSYLHWIFSSVINGPNGNDIEST